MLEEQSGSGSDKRPILGTWLLLDSAHEASFYPSTGFKSSDSPQVHRIYWRCVACYFASAFRMHATAYRLVLYTTVTSVPQEIQAVFDSCSVQINRVPLEHLPPRSYLNAWRNQFYILDVIRYISRHAPADTVILDSDCLFVASLDQLFARLRQEGVLTYRVEYPPDYKINGLSRLEMRQVFGELLGRPLVETPAYYGGEIFASTATELKRIDREIDGLWTQCMFRAARGDPKLNEEAQFLSYIYIKCGYRDATANAFIRRIWTQLAGGNGRREDLDLAIWHVPAEKRYGLRDLYSLVIDHESWFWKLPTNEQWKARLAALVGIPEASAFKKAKDFCRGARHKLVLWAASWGYRKRKSVEVSRCAVGSSAKTDAASLYLQIGRWKRRRQ